METLYRTLLALMFIASGALTPVSAWASDLISASDAQHFEQSYEEWASSLIKSINPKLKFTVLTQVEFSQNPEQLQAYEELRATNHLPGLPEVTDPIYSNPSESPLYALVAKKKIKIYFQNEATLSDERVIREVLGAKMKLSSNDALSFESLGTQKAQSSSLISRGVLAVVSFITGLSLLMSALFFRRKQKHLGKSDQPKIQSPHSPTTQILNANTATLRDALLGEKIEIIAKASLNATRRFSEQLLSEVPEGKFDLVNQWIERNKKTVSANDSNYARLLLAARLQQVQNQVILKSIETFSEARNMKHKILKSQETLKSVESQEVSV